MRARITAGVLCCTIALFSATAGGQQIGSFQDADVLQCSSGSAGCGDACTGCDACRCAPRRCCGIDVYGWLNAGFVGNPDDPDSRFNGPYNAVDRSNEPMLNQAYLVAERTLSADRLGIGGRADVIYGEDFFLAQSVGIENNDDGSTNWNNQYYGFAIPQAYVELGRRDLNVKVGHFYSIVGYEGLPAVNNFFYTKSYSYQFAGPFTHWGSLATWKPGDALELQFAATNGWDTFNRAPEDNVNLMAKAKFTGSWGWWTSLAAVTGDDINNPGAQPAITNDLTNRTRYSWLVSVPLTCRTEYVFHQWLGSQDAGAIDGGTAYWYGLDQYMFYTLNRCWKVGGRFEWFRDEDGTRVGLNRPSNPNKVPFVGDFYSVSTGVNWMPTDYLTVRPEVRYDWFNGEQAVQPYNDGAESSQFLLAIDAILKF